MFSFWYEPSDPDNPDDVAAADRLLEFQLGWFAHAIFGEGDYPDVMKHMVDAKSKQQGLKISRLPKFTDEEISYIKG